MIEQCFVTVYLVRAHAIYTAYLTNIDYITFFHLSFVNAHDWPLKVIVHVLIVRLAIVQEHNDPVVPVIPALGTNEEDHLAILEEIKCMVPDHNARVTSLQVSWDKL